MGGAARETSATAASTPMTTSRAQAEPLAEWTFNMNVTDRWAEGDHDQTFHASYSDTSVTSHKLTWRGSREGWTRSYYPCGENGGWMGTYVLGSGSGTGRFVLFVTDSYGPGGWGLSTQRTWTEVAPRAEGLYELTVTRFVCPGVRGDGGPEPGGAEGPVGGPIYLPGSLAQLNRMPRGTTLRGSYSRTYGEGGFKTTIQFVATKGRQAPPLPELPEPAPPMSTQEESRFRERVCNPGVGIGETTAGFSMGAIDIIHGRTLGRAVGRRLGVLGLLVTVPSVYCGFTAPPSQTTGKAIAAGACRGLTTASAGTGVAALVTSWTGVGGAAFGVTSLVTGLASTIPCAMDPPDPNFRVIPAATAVGVKLPALQKGTSPRLAKASQAYATNAGRIVGGGKAMFTCLNRASGARVASETVWERRQYACAADYAGRLSKLYITQRTLSRQLLAAVKANRIRNTKISRTRTVAAMRKFPPSVVAALRREGATPAEIAVMQKRVAEKSGSIQTPSSLYAAIDGPKTRAALTSASRAFTQLSSEYRAASQR